MIRPGGGMPHTQPQVVTPLGFPASGLGSVGQGSGLVVGFSRGLRETQSHKRLSAVRVALGDTRGDNG